MFVSQTTQQDQPITLSQMQPIPTGTTENGAVAHDTTYSTILDLFITAVGNHQQSKRMPRRSDVDVSSGDEDASKSVTDFSVQVAKLADAWNENPELLLKLIAQTRDPRNGKGERDLAFAFFRWLKKNKPATYRKNIARFAKEYGCWLDLDVMSQDETGWIDPFEMSLFADQLRADLSAERPSLAAKWAPREHGASRLKARALANLMFPRDPLAMMRYRKEVIVPLMDKLNVVEVKMCANDWESINFEQVPAKAMLLYGRNSVKNPHAGEEYEKKRKGAFFRHQHERFEDYREKVKDGKAEIKITGLQPHELVSKVASSPDDTVELQWSAMIDKLRQSGNLANAISIVDVSGSMAGTPMEVAIALGLVTSELSTGTFHNKVITFSEHPQFFDTTGSSLYERACSLQGMDWGASTNFQEAYRLILTSARMFNTPKEQMPKVIFVFTDMQFDQADRNQPEETLYDCAKAEFEAAGYEIPQMVFWNLRASEKAGFPVSKSQRGTAFVSGFSAVLLSAFMNGVEFTPLSILHAFLDRYVVEVDPSDLAGPAAL